MTLFGRTSKVISLLIVTIGLVSAILSLQSKFTINPGEPVKPSEVFSTPFDVVNDSPFPIYWINHSFEIYTILYVNGERYSGLRAFPAFPDARFYHSGEGTTLFCYFPEFDNKNVKAIDIGLRLYYRPILFPIKRSYEVRFMIGPDESGKLRIFKKPLA